MGPGGSYQVMNVSARALFLSFDGRINRATYWTRAFPVLLTLGLIVNVVLALEYKTTGSQGIASLVLSLTGMWPVLAVTVKRLHDRGRSGWFLLVIFIPILGAVWLLAEVWALPGADQANRFGDVPKDNGLPRRSVLPVGIVGVSSQVFLIAWIFFWPGAELRNALVANDYELIRFEVPVSGPVEVPRGNVIFLLQVDGSARIGDIELSECFAAGSDRSEVQMCRLDVSRLGGPADFMVFHGAPSSGTSAFSFEKADGRVIIALGPDLSHRNTGWLVGEINRPGNDLRQLKREIRRKRHMRLALAIVAAAMLGSAVFVASRKRGAG